MKLLKIFIVLAAFIALANVASADFDKTLWQYRTPLTVPETTIDYAIVDIPVSVFEVAKPDLSDLRIVDSSGDVPYMVASFNERDYITDVPSKMFNLSSIPKESTTFTVDLGQPGNLHSSIAVFTDSENFKRKVSVYSSDDQKNWALLTSGGLIYDFTVKEEKFKAGDQTVEYPESSTRYLKVVVDDNGEKPLNITGARVARKISDAGAELVYRVDFKSAPNVIGRATDVIVDAGGNGIPHRKVELISSAQNFTRRVNVYDSSDSKEWSPLGQAQIFSVNTPKFEGKSLKIIYGESRKRYLKLSIIDGDDKPIAIDGVTLSGAVKKILFRAEQGRAYELYVGNKKARVPEYDIAKISQYVDMKSLAIARLGSVEKNPDYNYIAPNIPFAEKYPYAIPAGLIVVVILLAGLLARLFLK